MFGSLYYRMKQGQYLRNPQGTKLFAEKCIGELVRGVTKKSAVYREMNENLLVEKANLRMRSMELSERPSLDAGEFFMVRRQLWLHNVIITAVVAAGVFLIFLSLSAGLGQEGVSPVLTWLVAAVLAIVLMGGGLVATERFVETIAPRRSIRTQELKDVTRSIAPLWIVVLVAVELALFGIAQVRADHVAASFDSTLLYWGFIIATMALPVIAGAIRWDAGQYIDIYKTTTALRQVESRLAQIDSVLRQNEEYESNFFKMKSIQYWDNLNDFKTYKVNYDEKKGRTEEIDTHFSRSYDEFQAEANKRYQADIRDFTSASMRRLEPADARPQGIGSKIGQAAGRRPVANPEAPNGTTTSDSNDLYLNPQPIR